MSLSSGFIKRPIATGLLMLAVVVLGAISYTLLPVASLPNIDSPTVQVTAQLPGADPKTVASSVATQLERQFGQIPGLNQMTSSSGTGFTQISLQFDRSRTIDSVSSDVQAAINATQGQLPAALLNPPIYRKTNPADVPILLIAMSSDVLPIMTVSDYAYSLVAQKLSQIPGVGIVGVGGLQSPAIRIQINPAQIAAQNLDFETVRTALANLTVLQPKGQLYGGQQSVALQSNDQLMTAAGFEDAIVAYRDGAPIRVRDIGRAIKAPQDVTLAGWVGEKPAVALAVQRAPGANVIATVAAIKKALPQLQASLPPGIDMRIASDRTQTIQASVADVQFTLLLTIALVVGVIAVFLRKLWATVIPAISVPISLVGTFAVMYVLGYSLDNLSLMALTIAIGFVVDDAIVMVENIVRHIEEGATPMQAALDGAGEIGFTILSISISLVAVFIPLFLMSGIVGLMFREFAVTVAVSILVSVVVSLTLTPMMCARLLPGHEEKPPGRLSRWLESFFTWLNERYDDGLKVALRHRFLTLLTFFGTVALTGYLFATIPKGFFPQQDTGLIIGISEAAQDVSPKGMKKRQQAILGIIAKDPAVADVAGYIGPGGPTVTENNGRVFITLKPGTERNVTADQVIQRLSTALDQVQGMKVFMQAAQDITIGAIVSKTQYQFTLTDVDLEELNLYGPKMLDALQKLPELSGVASDQQSGARMLNVVVDRTAASRLGIDPATVDNTLYDAFGQRHVARIYAPLNYYYVILEVDPQYQLGPNALQRIYVRSQNDTSVPLSQIAKLETGVMPAVINHQGQFPSVTLSFNLAPGATIGAAVAAVQKAAADLKMPSSVATAFQGNAQAFQTSLGSTPPLILAALFAVYVILGILYESTIHPLTILSTLPSAGLGALATLMLVGRPLDMIGIIGIILLIGIVKKNGIMLVDVAIEREREGGKSPEEAIHEACLLRFRPILMTTLCALLGGVPLMLGTGTGSEIRQPLGYAIVGGLVVSQVLTLFTTPVVYLYMDKLSGWLASMTRRPTEAGAASRPA
ncbi:efflux RND transporter permease subunit [Methylobacterium brachythecii]|uniref:Acriflavine resistance protein B n=1 Tax=Methylobacterium brachythecii TaxID=1176177 RepID=A0A7W6F8R6_9HYPH|nr:efflux RND transporter permease subunit [Methylobacterium brachythecii]MBB3904792.1 HAE1 family hydrophobic/amphiphilic exporter-1 [Methylobacterium brachythecii]GLS45345.1 acriflavine resistance protein B [Methylobacterium brachythecii]